MHLGGSTIHQSGINSAEADCSTINRIPVQISISSVILQLWYMMRIKTCLHSLCLTFRVFDVPLCIYSFHESANYLCFMLLCVTVHGSEYSFGAHDHPSSGVFEVEPKNCPGFIYRCSIFIGHTNLNPLEFREFIQRMASEYHGDTYHLISKNCNHFTDDICIRLAGKSIPCWVNRLARLGNNHLFIYTNVVSPKITDDCVAMIYITLGLQYIVLYHQIVHIKPTHRFII
jgi:hypothetical protein